MDIKNEEPQNVVVLHLVGSAVLCGTVGDS